MLLRHSLHLHEEAEAIERAVREVITDGARTADMVASPGGPTLSTTEMGDLIRGSLGALVAPRAVG
jgi:3-isopropylmalate dehydrogenase